MRWAHIAEDIALKVVCSHCVSVMRSQDSTGEYSPELMLQVQKGKDEVMLEFPADDAAGGDHEDALFEMSFHIPKENDRFGTGDESTSAAEVGTACSAYFY